MHHRLGDWHRCVRTCWSVASWDNSFAAFANWSRRNSLFKSHYPIQSWYAFPWNCNFRLFCCGFWSLLCFPPSPEAEGLGQPSLLKVERFQEEALHTMEMWAKESHPVCSAPWEFPSFCSACGLYKDSAWSWDNLNNSLFMLHSPGKFLLPFKL